MLKIFFTVIAANFFVCLSLTAQKDTILFARQATKENRAKDYRNLVNNSINKNLSLDLTAATEENWQTAFWAMELINYKSPWANNKIRSAFDSIEIRSTDFQRAALELIYTLQSKEHTSAVHKLLLQTGNSKVFAIH